MLSAKECRSKGNKALEIAENAISEEDRTVWTSMAKEWMALALSADAQEALQRNLQDRSKR